MSCSRAGSIRVYLALVLSAKAGKIALVKIHVQRALLVTDPGAKSGAHRQCQAALGHWAPLIPFSLLARAARMGLGPVELVGFTQALAEQATQFSRPVCVDDRNTYPVRNFGRRAKSRRNSDDQGGCYRYRKSFKAVVFGLLGGCDDLLASRYQARVRVVNSAVWFLRAPRRSFDSQNHESECDQPPDYQKHFSAPPLVQRS